MRSFSLNHVSCSTCRHIKYKYTQSLGQSRIFWLEHTDEQIYGVCYHKSWKMGGAKGVGFLYLKRQGEISTCAHA